MGQVIQVRSQTAVGSSRCMFNRIQIYITIYGDKHALDNFNNSLCDELKGSVTISRKGVGIWYSREAKETSVNPEEWLYELLIMYKEKLLKAKDTIGNDIKVTFVVEYRDWHSLCGFWFAPNTINIMADIGAGLDLDLYIYNE